MGYAPSNVADRVKMPKKPPIRTRMLTADEIDLVLEKAWKCNPSSALMLHLYASTGARAGELCSLRWRDIEIDDDRQSGWLNILTHAYPIPGGVREWPGTKNSDEGRKDIELDYVDIDRILRQRMLVNESAKRQGWATTDDDYVWPGRRDHTKPRTPSGISAFFRRVTRECGIGDAHLHGLRHRHLSLLAEGGPLTLLEMSDRAGVSMPVMDKVYIHSTGRRTRKIAGYANQGVNWTPPTTLELPAAGETTT
jgi:integrase